MSGFEQPSTDFFKSADFNGHLVLFEQIGTPYEAETNFGASPAIKATVTVLTHPEGPKVFNQTAIFGAAMVGTLSRANPGSRVLGRIGQGQAKPGQTAPWVINPFDPATDAPAAQAYIDGRAAASFQQAPVAPAVPQVQVPVAAPAVPQVQIPAVPQVQVPVAAPAVPQVQMPVAAPVPVQAPAAPAAAPAVNTAALTPEQLAGLPPEILAAMQAQSAQAPF